MNMSQYIQIIAVVIVFAIYIYGLFKVIKITRGSSPNKNKWNIVNGFTLATLFLIYLILNTYAIEPKDFALIMLTFGLVLATTLYAISAAKQADASVKMAEEMRQQRIMTSQPRLIQKSVHEKDIWEGSTKDYFSHFEIFNVGNIPAIEVESSLMDSEGNRSHSIRQTFLTNNDPPIKFRPSNMTNLEETKTYYIVCEYQNIFSHGLKNPLYQTRLPFKISKSGEEGKIYMVAGELEFKEASEEERIDAFSRRSKPK